MSIRLNALLEEVGRAERILVYGEVLSLVGALCRDMVDGACGGEGEPGRIMESMPCRPMQPSCCVQITPKMVAEWEYVGPSERCGPNWRSKLAGPNTSLLYRTTQSEPTGSAQPLLVSLTIPRPANGTVLEVC